jgi:hypothetical protein
MQPFSNLPDISLSIGQCLQLGEGRFVAYNAGLYLQTYKKTVNYICPSFPTLIRILSQFTSSRILS